MDAETRAEIRAACAAATPGPWRVGEPGFRCDIPEHQPAGHGGKACRYTFAGWSEWRYHAVARDPGYTPGSTNADELPVVAGMWDYEEGGIQRPEDAAFIAGARQWVPALLDALERCEAERDRLRDECQRRAWREAELTDGRNEDMATAADAAVTAFRQSPPPDLRVIHDGAGRVTRLLLAGEVVE
ncbi:MAG TPA: hypothetical protein VM597_33715 [Gemmataceae bacterium]|nr:hypothetical protein [Gemmataceae bacterium]